jgi:hypothetical protein
LKGASDDTSASADAHNTDAHSDAPDLPISQSAGDGIQADVSEYISVHPLTVGQEKFLASLPLVPPRWQCIRDLWELQTAAPISGVLVSLQNLVARHEGLRTRFRDDELAGGVQEVDARLEPLPVTIVRDDLQAADIVNDVEFDLACEPGWRAILVASRGHVARVHMVIHHILADDWGIQILRRDFLAGLPGGEVPAVMAPPFQPRELAYQQRSTSGRQRAERGLRHWHTVALDASSIAYRVRDLVPEWRQITMKSCVPVPTLNGVSDSLHISLPSLMLTTLSVARCLALSESQVAFGLGFDNRPTPRLQSTLADTGTTVPFVIAINEQQTFRSLAAEAHTSAMAAYLRAGSYDTSALQQLLDQVWCQQSDSLTDALNRAGFTNAFDFRKGPLARRDTASREQCSSTGADHVIPLSLRPRWPVLSYKINADRYLEVRQSSFGYSAQEGVALIDHIAALLHVLVDNGPEVRVKDMLRLVGRSFDSNDLARDRDQR